MIDYTQVEPNATRKDIIMLCKEAREYGFGAVCVNPFYVPLVKDLLKDTDVKICTAIGFPFGATFTEVKVVEARKAIEKGANEIDTVINIGALKSGDYAVVTKDVKEVVKAAHSYGDVIVKVIIEAGYLTSTEKIEACKIAKDVGADFVKTSTGFAGGATVEDVRLIRRIVDMDMGVKAAGGIRTLNDALAMIKAGANRIGTSTGVAIIKEYMHKH